MKIFLVALALLALSAAQPNPLPSCERLCTQNQCNYTGNGVPFNCTSNCIDPNQRFGRTTRLPCDTKIATAALTFGSCNSGGGDHALYFADPLNAALAKGCTSWDFVPSNGISSGIFNEFDDNNDGVYDRAELSGVVRPICNNAKDRTLEIRLFLVRVLSPDQNKATKNELNGNCVPSSADYKNLWYFYSLDTNPAKKSYLIGGGALLGLYMPLRLFMGMNFEVGVGASMKNIAYGATAWIEAPPPYTYDANWSGPTIETLFPGCTKTSKGDINVNLACNCKCPDNPPPSVCGNGIIENGEQCDGGVCCTSNCTFVPSTTVCRPSAGDCDVPESCTGSSATCPTDAYQPTTVPCNQPIGICDVYVDTNCPGNGPTCQQLPIITQIHQIPIQFENYNAISFGDFVANTGDTEGRVAAKSNVSLGNGYSVGYLTQNNGNNGQFTPFALIAGRDLYWGSGAVYPDGSGIPIPDQLNEEIFVGGTAYVPGYLQALVTGTCGVSGCLDSQFDIAQTFYKYMQSQFAALTPNTQASIKDSGLRIQCDSNTAPRYVLNVDASIINSITWYTTHNCNLAAVWIINVQGSGAVTFSGDFLPAIAERTLWNILGSGRTVNVVTEVRGNILAPENTLQQTGGVIKGKVVFGNVAFSLQINLPKCYDLIIVKVTDFCAKPGSPGETCVTLKSGGVIAVGDQITFSTNPSVSYTVTGKVLNTDGTMTVCFATPLVTPVSIGSQASVSINPNVNLSGRSDAPTGIQSGAASTLASVALIVAALVALML